MVLLLDRHHFRAVSLLLFLLLLLPETQRLYNFRDIGSHVVRATIQQIIIGILRDNLELKLEFMVDKLRAREATACKWYVYAMIIKSILIFFFNTVIRKWFLVYTHFHRIWGCVFGHHVFIGHARIQTPLFLFLFYRSSNE